MPDVPPRQKDPVASSSLSLPLLVASLLLMFSLMLVGTGLWLAYGLLLGRPALIFANGTSLSLIAWIGWFKLRYG